MKISATAAVLALAAAAQRVSATDFDFRDFEGLWETTDVQISLDTGNTSVYGTTPANILGNFNCKKTNDFRKAMCELTAVTQADQGCLGGQTFPGPLVSAGRSTAVQKCKFMMDQFDAETGKVDPLMCDLQCCGSDGLRRLPLASCCIRLQFPGWNEP